MMVPHAHNLFVQLLVDYGIPGLVVMASLLFIVISRLWLQVLVGGVGQEGWWMSLALLAGVFVTLFEHMFDLFLWSPHLWYMVGLASAALRIESALARKTVNPGSAGDISYGAS